MADKKKLRADHSLLDGIDNLFVEKKSGRIDRVKGVVSLNGIDYKVNIKYTGPTPRGNYRGTVTTINPSDGKLMESDKLLHELLSKYRVNPSVGRSKFLDYIVDQAFRERYGTIQDAEEADRIRKEIYKEKEKWLRERILSQCAVDFTVKNINKADDIKAKIIKCVNKLALREADQLRWALKRSLMPTEITPITAAQIFIDEYLAVNYSDSPEEKNKRRRREIFDSLAAFGGTPMCEITSKEMSKSIEKYKWSSDRQSTLRSFWRWCLGQGIYEGSDPFVQREKRPKSTQSRDDDAVYSDILSQSEKITAINELKTMQSGMACGIALLMSGYDVNTAMSFTWGNMTIVKSREDYAYIEWVKDIRGPIKTFTRVILPAVAPILIERYNAARVQNKEEYLSWPIVAQERDMGKPIDKKQFEETAVLLLKQILAASRRNTVHASKTMFTHTYINDLYRHCGIGDDEGTISYLSGISPKNTTDIYYVPYSSPEALARQYTILSRLSPPVKVRLKRKPLMNKEGNAEYTISPTYSNQRAHTFARITLRPSETIEIKSQHGITGTVMVLLNTEDATE